MFAEGDSIQISAIYVVGILATAGSVIAFLFKSLITSKDRELAAKEEKFNLIVQQKDKALQEVESIKKSYQEIATEALKSATDTANFYRNKEGRPPIIPTAPVIAESHSPSTAAQREAALIQTMRAAMAKVKLESNQEPRPEPPKSAEEQEVKDRGQYSLDMKKDIEEVPEKTAIKVVEKLKEQ